MMSSHQIPNDIRPGPSPQPKKVCLVCSSGGHFVQMYSMCELWKQYECLWVTFPGEDTDCLLRDANVVHAYHPTNRSIKNLIRNIGLAWTTLRRERPSAIVSTGAGVAVPFMLIGRLLGIRTIYIDSLTRTDDLSLSGRLLYRWVHTFLVQWPAVAEKHPRALFRGRVL